MVDNEQFGKTHVVFFLTALIFRNSGFAEVAVIRQSERKNYVVFFLTALIFRNFAFRNCNITDERRKALILIGTEWIDFCFFLNLL